MSSYSPQFFGWIKDNPDYRDYRLVSFERPLLAAQLPASFDLSRTIVWIYDQEALGSCVGNSAASIFRFVDQLQGGLNIEPSRLQIYYDARKMRGWETIDSGAMIRDALKILAIQGTAPEEQWPYNISRFAEQPSPSVYAAALEHQALVYLRVDQNLTAMKSCLVAGYPLIIGSALYENFLSIGSDGVAQMPAGRAIGGHAYLVVGYDDITQRFKCMNSWGPDWGAGGYFFMPYTYLTDSELSDDLWTIRQTEETPIPQPTPEPAPAPAPTPAPGVVPVIQKVRYRKRRKLVVSGKGFHPDASLWLDGFETIAGEYCGRFAYVIPDLTGKHTVQVHNPDAESDVVEFEL